MPTADQLSFSTISYVTMPVGTSPAVVPHPLEELVPAVAAAGFTRIGLDWFTIRDAERRGAPVDLGGLVPTELCALGLGADPAGDERAARSMARRCAELGIPVCVLASTAPLSDDLCARVAAIMPVFGDTRLAIEFLPYSGVRTLAAARELSARTGCGLVLDTLHMLRSGCPPTELAGTDDIACVQLADGPADPPAEPAEESRSGRLLPGAGAYDFAGLAAALDRIGYAGPLTAELLSRTLRAVPPAELAGTVRAACRAALAG